MFRLCFCFVAVFVSLLSPVRFQPCLLFVVVRNQCAVVLLQPLSFSLPLFFGLSSLSLP